MGRRRFPKCMAELKAGELVKHMCVDLLADSGAGCAPGSAIE